MPRPVDEGAVGKSAGIVTSTAVEFSKEKIAYSVGEYAKHMYEGSKNAIPRGECGSGVSCHHREQ